MSSRSHEEIDQLASDYGRNFTPDVEAGLTRLHDRLGIKGKGNTGKIRRMTTGRWLSIAAALLFLIAVGTYAFSTSTTLLSNETNAPLAVDLPDGSSVILQEGASLTYGSDFAEVDRRIDMEGQGFFTIAKDTQKPFLVTSGTTTLRVTGTAFNLRVVNEELEVEVSEGSVELAAKDKTIRVAAKQCGVAKSGASPVIMEAPNLNRHAWRTGKLIFEDTPLSEVLTTLRHNWDVDIDAPENCDYGISANYATINLKDILDGVAKQGGIACESEDGKTFRFIGSCGD